MLISTQDLVSLGRRLNLVWTPPKACLASPYSAATPASGELTFIPIVPAPRHAAHGGGDVNGAALTMILQLGSRPTGVSL